MDFISSEFLKKASSVEDFYLYIGITSLYLYNIINFSFCKMGCYTKTRKSFCAKYRFSHTADSRYWQKKKFVVCLFMLGQNSENSGKPPNVFEKNTFFHNKNTFWAWQAHFFVLYIAVLGEMSPVLSLFSFCLAETRSGSPLRVSFLCQKSVFRHFLLVSNWHFSIFLL